jgi:hypothetical protein
MDSAKGLKTEDGRREIITPGLGTTPPFIFGEECWLPLLWTPLNHMGDLGPSAPQPSPPSLIPLGTQLLPLPAHILAVRKASAEQGSLVGGVLGWFLKGLWHHGLSLLPRRT